MMTRQLSIEELIILLNALKSQEIDINNQGFNEEEWKAIEDSKKKTKKELNLYDSSETGPQRQYEKDNNIINVHSRNFYVCDFLH